MQQRTEEWFQAKLGKASASRVADIMAKTKSGYSASRKNYMAELICERLTGVKTDHYLSAPMQWGIDNEPLARSAYEAKTGVWIEEVGFVEHPTIDSFGASPDGLIDNDGGIEIKCPNTATHIEYLLTVKIDKKYIYQMQAGMMCTGREWWDFVSYDPRLSDKMSLYIQRVFRDEIMISEMEIEIKMFNAEIDKKIKDLEEKYGN